MSRTFWIAVSRVKGGSGGRGASAVLIVILRVGWKAWAPRGSEQSVAGWALQDAADAALSDSPPASACAISWTRFLPLFRSRRLTFGEE